ncbi:FAD/NAD(P)-binding domain-containing protein [Penicillium argentinense]|uniref:FAD/NAD(P)-binding domain-containing protein n=1 Tax=Penicillium argentinense TaxID=1131581 RepID=A0A9W9K2H5_9EURO|nr:FAD/NAD(P)-binding domain-containing protein [Penicillium argentinense]KAJ5090658.1 FAD/NAD(P)-binding domain-containing protein [Penicillium argentinense]
MADKPAPHTIAIIGGGVAGPVLALTILSHPVLKERYKPVIYERLPRPKPSTFPDSKIHGENNTTDTHSTATYAAGAAVALTSNALYPLYALGLRDSLDFISSESTRIKIWRAWDTGKHKYCQQLNHPNWQEDLGTNLRVVERAGLQRVVLDRVRELGGEVIWERKVTDVKSATGGGVKVCFEGGEEVEANLVVGADGGWSVVRRHIMAIAAADGGGGADRWKPEFAYADGIYGVSKPIDRARAIESEEDVQDGDTHWVLLDSGTASTWALPGRRQFWSISFPSNLPPKSMTAAEHLQKQNKVKLYGADLILGKHDLEETQGILKRYENAFHPIAGNFGELYKRSERIVRAPLWYHAWEESEIGGKNIVLIGDASRLMLPTSGQGAGFAIEDATVLANELLNNPPSSENGRLDFSRAIEAYAQARVPRSKSMTKQSYWTSQLGLGARWWWRWLRDAATMYIPLGGDSKVKSSKKPKDPMGWLYEVRYKVELREKQENPRV